MTFEQILALFENPKKSGDGFVARCPAHDDRNPSLSIAEGDDGRTLLNCHAGCETGDIVKKIGLRLSDLFDASRNYRDGRTLKGQKLRAESKTIGKENILRLKKCLTDEARKELEQDRVISGRIIEKYELGMAPENSERRITIPIKDECGHYVDVRRWLPPPQRNNESSKILHWRPGYGGVRLFPIDQIKYDEILFCEGELDALAAISAGLHAITLTAGAGSVMTKADARKFDGKNVVILMDHDDGGRRGAEKRARALAPHARMVKVAEWPKGRVAKWDVTDELLKHGKESLKSIIAASVPFVDKAPQLPAPYEIRDGRLGYLKPQRRGKDEVDHVFIPLSNFTARIIEDQARDDGAEVQRRFLIEGVSSNGRPLPTTEVPAVQFSSLSWVGDKWGVKAVIESGQATKDRLRHAIQVASQGAEERYAYAHTGWRKINGTWVYLHTGHDDFEVVLEGKGKNYRLPSKIDNLPAAIRQSLSLLQVAPLSVTLPLLATVYLAPVCQWLKPDFALWVVGQSGTRKSTLTALFMAHYGDFFDKSDLPGSWESTDNAIEKLLFELKDVLVCVDDYAPRADSVEQRKQAGRAQRVIRQMGNSTGRGRLRADLSIRPDRPPRGLMISTGEDLPPGQSVMARVLAIEVVSGSVDLTKLSSAQKETAQLTHAMAGYIDWLKPRVNSLKEELLPKFIQYRNKFDHNRLHGRIPEALSYLAIGIDLLVDFATDSGAISEQDRERICSQAREELVALGQAHGQRVGEADAAEVFLTALTDLLSSGACVLEQKNKIRKDDLIEIVGWCDSEYAYLIPQVARGAVVKFMASSGGFFPFTPNALYKALDAHGALMKGRDGKSTASVKIAGRTRRVLQIPIHFLEVEEKEEEGLS